MSTGRARRATAKKVDYAKEQEFSDEDIFEDSEEEAPAPSSKRGRAGRPSMPRSTGKKSNALVEEEAEEGGDFSYKQVYTEKGYDPTMAPIRERFPFLPEYEEDGSPKLELIVGRRAVDDPEDTPEENDKENDDEEEAPKTRGRRVSKKASPIKANEPSHSGPIEYEYLVKYKGRSYLHLEWKTGADLESMNKSAKGIYRRYLKKLQQGTDDDLENPEFDPSYSIPERIIDEAEQEITVELTDKELLRWEKQREKELAEEDSEDDKSESKEEEEEAPEEAKDEPAEQPNESEMNGEGTMDVESTPGMSYPF